MFMGCRARGPRELYRPARRTRKRDGGPLARAGAVSYDGHMRTKDAGRRLEEAAQRSPELTAMLAARRGGPSALHRRVATLVGGGVLGIGLVWLAVSSMSTARSAAEPRPFEPAEEIDRSHWLAQIKTQPEGSGEETAPFEGFAISVETVPAGAVVSILGTRRGEAPVLANVECRGTEPVEIRAEKPGFLPARREVGCRADALLKLTLRLERR
jgi:hypothetical protein